MQNNNIPILYTFRRCPYAIRARMAIFSANIQVDLHEVSLKDKPKAMLEASSKGTVPVLCIDTNKVIDESIEIMQWALEINDPNAWLDMSEDEIKLYEEFVAENDSSFKYWLDKYKYASRFPEFPEEHYRNQAEIFLNKLETLLQKNNYLLASVPKIADMAIFPFIRQFSMVDNKWFDNSKYIRVREWLNSIITSPLFLDVMKKRE